MSVLAAFAAAGKNVALVLRPQYAIADLGGLPIPENARFLSDVAGPYAVANPESVRRLVDQAHLQGIKVVTYVSPYYYYTTDVSLFVENVLAIREQTGIDGVYLDGLYRNDFLASRELMVQLRTALGEDAFIALHHSKDTVLRTDIKTPYFETLADVVWTGENVSTLTVELATLDAASGTLQVFLPETRSDAEGNPLSIEAQIDLLLAEWIKVRRVGVLDRSTGTRNPFPTAYYDAALAELWDSVQGE